MNDHDLPGRIFELRLHTNSLRLNPRFSTLIEVLRHTICKQVLAGALCQLCHLLSGLIAVSLWTCIVWLLDQRTHLVARAFLVATKRKFLEPAHLIGFTHPLGLAWPVMG